MQGGAWRWVAPSRFHPRGCGLLGAGWLVEQLGIGATGITIIVSSILLVLGIYFVFVYRPRPALFGEDKLTGDLRRGVLLGMANPQLLLFWCGVKLMCVFCILENMTSDAVVHLLAFGLGAFTGAIILLMILVRLGVKARRSSRRKGCAPFSAALAGCCLVRVLMV